MITLLDIVVSVLEHGLILFEQSSRNEKTHSF